MDALVIGAGPAGCAAARMLASFGHRVLLVDRPSAGRRSLAESIPPSTNRLLVELGMKDAVDAARFHPWLGNTVWWGSDQPRVEPFATGDAGVQVERARFDAVLRDVAAKAGAEIVSGAANDPQRLEAKIVLDCSGRAGVIARQGYRQVEASHRTVALVAVWRAKAPWPAGQRGHTLVAAHPDGWAWSVPTADDVRYFTVMVDPERSRLTKGAPSLDVYLAELRKVAPFVPWLDGADLIDGPWGADASLYSTSQYSGPGFLLVGDAASFIDPLSSFGVKKALASGWLAAITANTILKTPAMADEARAFYERHERGVVESFRQQTAQFAAETANADQHPFWEARVQMSSEANFSVMDQGESGEIRLRAQSALADLRRRSEINLERGDQVRTGPRAAIRDHLIVMDDHLFLPEWPDGIRYLRNIDLMLLMRLAPEHHDVGVLYDAVFREQPGVSLPDFLGALSTLIARGALQHRAP
jgi:flavin-dependent dehydrogenase